MALDPEEFVTLTDHGLMKLRAAVLRAMTLLPKERKRTTIVREGEPAIFRADKEPCGAVGRTARANRLTSFPALVSVGSRPQKSARARPTTG